MTDLHAQLDQVERAMRNPRVMGDSGIRISGSLMSGLKVDMDVAEEVVTVVGAGVVTPPPPPGTGACCVDGVCTIETEDDCTGMGGTYQGDDTVCDPNPCEFCAITTIDLTTRIYGSYDSLVGDGGAGTCAFSFDATEFRNYVRVEGVAVAGEFTVNGLDPDCVINLPLDRIDFDVSSFVSGCADTCEEISGCLDCVPHPADICTSPGMPESNCLYAKMNFGIDNNFDRFSWFGTVSCDDQTAGEGCDPFSLICGTGFSSGTKTEDAVAVAGTYFFTYSQTFNGVNFNFEVTLVIS